MIKNWPLVLKLEWEILIDINHAYFWGILIYSSVISSVILYEYSQNSVSDFGCVNMATFLTSSKLQNFFESNLVSSFWDKQVFIWAISAKNSTIYLINALFIEKFHGWNVEVTIHRNSHFTFPRLFNGDM